MTERTPVYIVTDGADRPTALGVFEDGDTIPSGTLTPNVRDAVEEIDTFDGRLDGVEASTVDLSSYIETNETAWGQGIDPATLADIQEVSNVVTTASGPNEDIRTAYGPYSSLASGTSAAGTVFASVDGGTAVLKTNLDGGFGFSVTGVVNVNATNVNATNNVTGTNLTVTGTSTLKDLSVTGTATLNGLSVTGSVSAGDNFSGTNAHLTGGLSAEGAVSAAGKVISADQIQGDSLRATNDIIVGGTVDTRNVAEDGAKTDDLVTAYAPVSSLASGVSAAASAIESVDSTIVVFSKEVKTTKTYTDNLTSHLTSEITLDANIDAANNDITNVASLGVTDATISNAANVTGNLTVTGTVSAAGDVKTTGSLSSTVGVNTETVSTNTLTHNGAGNITLGRGINADGKSITDIKNLTATGTTTLTTGDITTGTIGTANVTGDLTVTGAYSGAGDVKTTGAFSGTGNVLTEGNIVAQGNVQATSINVDRLDNNSVGDVTLYTDIDGNNQDITALGIVGATTGNITTVNATDANISNDLTVTGAYSGAGDVKTTGAFSGTGNVTTQGNVSAGGEVAAGTVKANTLDDDGSTSITLNARIDANSKNISNVNTLTAATGTITTGNITTVNATDANLTGDLTVTGAYSGAGDVKTTGAFSGTGNITTLGTVAAATGDITTVNSTTGNIITVDATTVNTANANITGNISVTGNANVESDLTVTGAYSGAGDVKTTGTVLTNTVNPNTGNNLQLSATTQLQLLSADRITLVDGGNFTTTNFGASCANFVDHYDNSRGTLVGPSVDSFGSSGLKFGANVYKLDPLGAPGNNSVIKYNTTNDQWEIGSLAFEVDGNTATVNPAVDQVNAGIVNITENLNVSSPSGTVTFGTQQTLTPSSNTFSTRNILVGNELSSGPECVVNLEGSTIWASGSVLSAGSGCDVTIRGTKDFYGTTNVHGPIGTNIDLDGNNLIDVNNVTTANAPLTLQVTGAVTAGNLNIKNTATGIGASGNIDMEAVGDITLSSPSLISLDADTVTLDGTGAFGLSGGAVDIESTSTYLKLNSAAYVTLTAATNLNLNSADNGTQSVSIDGCPFPNPFIQVKANTGLNINSAANVAVTFSGVDVSGGGKAASHYTADFAATATSVQVDTAGTYEVGFNIMVYDPASTTAVRSTHIAQITKNGTVIGPGSIGYVRASSGSNEASYNMNGYIVNLSASDKIGVNFERVATTTATTDIVPGYDHTLTIKRIG